MIIDDDDERDIVISDIIHYETETRGVRLTLKASRGTKLPNFYVNT